MKQINRHPLRLQIVLHPARTYHRDFDMPVFTRVFK